jgi:hypothetical protein
VTSEKVYYYELIAYSNDNISIFKNPKKMTFLEEMGYDIWNDLEISLATYAANIVS